MNVEAAVNRLDGHAILSVETAQKVCQTLEVSFPESLIITWGSGQDALTRYNFVALSDGPGSGVDGLDLSYHVARSLDAGAPGIAFSGKGSQARANREAIQQKLQTMGKWTVPEIQDETEE